MAAMREELILADRFSDPLRNYASGLGRAADATRRMAQGAGSGAEALSQAWRGMAQGSAESMQRLAGVSEMSASQQLKAYQSMLSGISQEMVRLDVINAAGANRADAMVAAGKRETEAFKNLDSAMERSGQRYRELADQRDVLRGRIESVTSACESERQANLAAAAARETAASRTYVGGVQADTAQALASSRAALAGAQNSVQMYAQSVAAAQNETNRNRMALELESQALQLTIEKYGAGSAAAMQQAQSVSQATEAVDRSVLREQAHLNALTGVAGGSQEASRAMDEYRNSTNQAANATSGLMDKLKGLLGTYMGLRGLKEMAGLSDTMVQTRARLDLINDGSMGTDELQKMIFDSAQRSRGDYGNTADMVAKMGIMAGDAFSGPNKLGELVGFSEVLNKMYTVSGTGLAGQRAATLQLQQAMAMGVLRGQEFRSVIQQVPMLVQAIGTSLGVSTGEVKKLADEGKITADVVKNAMFNAADMVEDKFAEMPMTWGQVWTSMKNQAMIAAQPVLEAINWIANHMEQLAPIFAGAAAGALAFAVALGIQTVATWIATGAALAFFAALLTNPITYIVLAVVLLVFALYRWAQSIGGVKVAWLTAVDIVLTWWDKLKIGFFSGVYWVQNLLDNMGLAFQTAGVAIQDFMGDMKVGVLTILQNLINGAVGIINDFISMLNMIPGVNIGLIGQVTFATTAAAENEAAKQARGAALADAQQQLADAAAARDAAILQMQIDAANNQRSRQMGIDAERRMAEAAKSDGLDISSMATDIGNIAGDTGKIAQKVDASDEDLKYLEDVAVRRYETKVNTTNLTPTINVNVNGNADRGAADDIASAIASILAQQAASHTAVSYAEVGV